jgi:gluconokinase
MENMVVVLMGVAGSGKTTVGDLLARRLKWHFYDADDFHTAHNREKMSRGIPLDDDDRRPWLEAIRGVIEQCLGSGTNAIIACSALKQSYRELLTTDSKMVKFVYLKGQHELIAARLAHRQEHFFNPRLLQSQFDELEEPPGGIEIDVSKSIATVVQAVIDALKLS